MCTSILPDRCTIVGADSLLKTLAHRERREVPITSCVALVSRAKSSSAVGTSSPTTTCTEASRLRGEFANLAHFAGSDRPSQPVASYDVHHHEFGTGLRCDTGRAAYQRLRLGTAGNRDDDTFARFPHVGDLVVGAVFGQCGIDLVGKPQQRQFP